MNQVVLSIMVVFNIEQLGSSLEFVVDALE